MLISYGLEGGYHKGSGLAWRIRTEPRSIVEKLVPEGWRSYQQEINPR